MKTNFHTIQQEAAERRLLDAALKLVAEKGTARMTLAEVGAMAGYSRTLPAHHFGNRAGLLKALVDYVHQLLFDEMRQRRIDLEGLEAILEVVRAYLRPDRTLSLAQRAVYALRVEALSGDTEVAEHMTGFYRRCESFMESQLRLGVERGEIRPDIDPARQTMLILGMLRGTVAQWINEEDNIDLVRVRDDAVDLVRRTLAAEA